MGGGGGGEGGGVPGDKPEEKLPPPSGEHGESLQMLFFSFNDLTTVAC